jgi:hypothetical protein
MIPWGRGEKFRVADTIVITATLNNFLNDVKGRNVASFSTHAK